uniref:MADF domain-containing protein n=1 Tax=Clytia hemisphaerica TaxID=252671 RepID=A0A7M5U9C9_9CNID
MLYPFKEIIFSGRNFMKMDYLDQNTQIVVLPNDGNFDQWVQLKATTGKKESVQAKKPGRPPSLLKGDVNREWVDHETTHLIKLWAGYENLYNSCHVHFFNRNIRANTLDTISRELQKVGITATSKQISKKFADLKTYYQFQVRKLEKEKEENSKTENEIESPWRFFEQLHFLNKSMKPIPQSVESNTELEGNNLQRAHRKRKFTTQTLSRNIELPKESLIETPASQHVFQQKGAILPIDENGEMSSDAPNVIAESKTSGNIYLKNIHDDFNPNSEKTIHLSTVVAQSAATTLKPSHFFTP